MTPGDHRESSGSSYALSSQSDRPASVPFSTPIAIVRFRPLCYCAVITRCIAFFTPSLFIPIHHSTPSAPYSYLYTASSHSLIEVLSLRIGQCVFGCQSYTLTHRANPSITQPSLHSFDAPPLLFSPFFSQR